MSRRPWPRPAICQTAPSNGRRYERRDIDWAVADAFPTPFDLLRLWAVIEGDRRAGGR